MPRTKQKNHKKVTRKSQSSKKLAIQAALYQTLMRRPETVIGLIIIVIFGLALLVSSITAFKENHLVKRRSVPLVNRVETPIHNEVSTPAAAIATATSSALFIPAPTLSPTATPTAQLNERIVVKKDQTFWELAQKYCGSHNYSDTLARNNGYKSVSKLREGDRITINCKSR